MISSKFQSEPYEEFVASIKLVTGEEILGKVAVIDDDTDNVIVDTPVICHEVRTPGANIPMGYKFEPWMKMSNDDVFVLNMKNVITMSEITDEDVLITYSQLCEAGFKRTHPDLDRNMGYINSVEKSRNIIEKLFKGDDASKEPKKD
tara:strand:- start:124 stop:564 length:441 start_codon:yes stop_codon:yes gene_type:complete